MGWWIAAILTWLMGAVWIAFVMADVFRGKVSGLSKASLTGYAIHGALAIVALWLVIKALGA